MCVHKVLKKQTPKCLIVYTVVRMSPRNLGEECLVISPKGSSTYIQYLEAKELDTITSSLAKRRKESYGTVGGKCMYQVHTSCTSMVNIVTVECLIIHRNFLAFVEIDKFFSTFLLVLAKIRESAVLHLN